MKIPNKLNGFFEEIKLVKFNQKEMDEFVNDKTTENTLGYYDPDGPTIYYVDNKDKFETILHELGHYFFERLGMDYGEVSAEIFAKFVESNLKQLQISI